MGWTRSCGLRLRRALSDLIESHDQELARYVSDGSLALDWYKEYIELFARSLHNTMSSSDGVGYLLEACGFIVDKETMNLFPGHSGGCNVNRAPDPARQEGTQQS